MPPKQPSEATTLLASLRDQACTITNSTSPSPSTCATCNLQRRTHCPHLTRAQAVSLRARKRTAASERALGTMRVFDCGHAFRALRRADRDARALAAYLPSLPSSYFRYRGRKTYTRGLCADCWCRVASDGRRREVRPVAREAGGRRRRDAAPRGTPDRTRWRVLKGRYTAWEVGGGFFIEGKSKKKSKF